MSSKGFWICQDGHFCDLLRPVSAGAAQTSTRFNLANYAHAPSCFASVRPVVPPVQSP